MKMISSSPLNINFDCDYNLFIFYRGEFETNGFNEPTILYICHANKEKRIIFMNENTVLLFDLRITIRRMKSLYFFEMNVKLIT